MKYYFLEDFIGTYSAPKDIPGGSVHDNVNLLESDCNVIYNIYDELVEKYPHYVTKKKLGEAFSWDMNSYTIANFDLENKSYFPLQRFKICIVTSIHGYEQGCAWTTAQFFKLLCENTDNSALNFLRRNVVFEVLPIANPWGFSHNERKNGHGIDLNRNFKEHFVYNADPSTGYYGGESPCSETETKLIMDFIENNLDAQVVLDYHNIAKGYPLFYVHNQKDVPLAYSVFSTLTDKWKKEYPQFPQDRILGLVRPSATAGKFADYLIGKNLWGLTMETPWCMPDIGEEKYDSATIRTALEVLVNTLLAIVRSYR